MGIGLEFSFRKRVVFVARVETNLQDDHNRR